MQQRPNMATAILILYILIFIVYPPLNLFITGTSSGSGTALDGELLKAAGNSLQLAGAVFVLATLIGGVLAWVVVKTDLPGKRYIDHLALISFAIPPYVLALSYLQVAGRGGYAQRIINALLGADTYTADPYSLFAAILILSLHLYPLMYFNIRNSLKKVPPETELAATLSGARIMTSIRTVTLPMIRPSIVSTGLLVFSRSLANFSVPAALCLPAGIQVVPTGIYAALSGFDVQRASWYSLLLVLISTAMNIMTLRFMIIETTFLKGSSRSGLTIRLTRAVKITLAGMIFIFFLLSNLIPLSSMFISSFLQRWGLPVSREYLTLQNYRYLFSSPDILRAFRNSLVYGITAGGIAAVIAGACTLFVHRKRTLFSQLIMFLVTWPMAIPNTVLAVASIYAFNRWPLKLYGTPWGIIMTYSVLFSPIIYRQIEGLMVLYDQRYTAAAVTCGASRLQVLRTIILPFLLPGFSSSMLICLMIALREIPISLLLYSSGQETVGVLLFGMQSQSYGMEMTSALSMVLILIILAGNRLSGQTRRLLS
jgi:iron(III) transport system permease protein